MSVARILFFEKVGFMQGNSVMLLPPTVIGITYVGIEARNGKHPGNIIRELLVTQQ
jgi:hypothetical protein